MTLRSQPTDLAKIATLDDALAVIAQRDARIAELEAAQPKPGPAPAYFEVLANADGAVIEMREGSLATYWRENRNTGYDDLFKKGWTVNRFCASDGNQLTDEEYAAVLKRTAKIVDGKVVM